MATIDDIDCMRLLLETSCNVNIQDNNGYTALFLATLMVNNCDALNLLLDYKPNIDITDNFYHTAFSLGVYLNKTKTDKNIIKKLQLLADVGTDVNHYDKQQKMNPIIYAIMSNNRELIVFLYNNGASLNIKWNGSPTKYAIGWFILDSFKKKYIDKKMNIYYFE